MADDFQAVFDELKPLLEPYADPLAVTEDSATTYALDTPYSEQWNRALFFGKVEIGKAYVSYHLFPVYMYPDLLDNASDELRKRMQGKSCFNFTRVDPGLRQELDALTRRGYERLEREDVI